MSSDLLVLDTNRSFGMLDETNRLSIDGVSPCYFRLGMSSFQVIIHC